jgi:GxxExxY protein
VSTLASIASIFSCRRVIVEVKATHKLAYADRLQVMNYVIAMHLDVGLLLHFGPRPDIKRVLGVGWRPEHTRSNPGSSGSSSR